MLFSLRTAWLTPSNKCRRFSRNVLISRTCSLRCVCTRTCTSFYLYPFIPSRSTTCPCCILLFPSSSPPHLSSFHPIFLLLSSSSSLHTYPFFFLTHLWSLTFPSLSSSSFPQVFIQLIKQTAGVPLEEIDTPGVLSCWQTLACMCCTFIPERAVKSYLTMHIKK